MKPSIFIIPFIVAALSTSPRSAAQDGITQALRAIEANNKELQADRQLAGARKLEARAENNLPDPTLSYAHLWNSKEKNETVGELIVSQSFDFPTLYVSRGKLNRLKADTYDSQSDLLRQQKLLEAKELCLDIIMLRQQRQILEERLNDAEELDRLYAKRLRTGDANAIETNKVALELLNAKTEVSLNETALRGKLRDLTALNAGIPLAFGESHYPEVSFPADYAALRAEALATDRSLHALAGESLVARRQLSVNRSAWLPRLELGYRRDTEAGARFNGIVMGVSFPLFSNRHKVKMAKAQALNVDLLREDATTRFESELSRLYEEARTLRATMDEYRSALHASQSLALLKKALAGGQMNVMEYFMEVSVVYQSRQNYLLLENQYQKAMARIYKGRL
ncbi:MAG: TolC family protein [Mediterranea sp.]|jgi:outer membrane protein TolC|nr:TolC family protein [Mediterranea sp.]